MAINGKLVIFRYSNDTIAVSHILDQEHKGVTKQGFFDQHSAKLHAHPKFINTEMFIVDEKDYIALASNALYGKRSIRCDVKGKLYIDKNYKSPLNLLSESRLALREKLKLKLGLSDEELDVLLGK